MFASPNPLQPSLFGDASPAPDRAFASLERVVLDEGAWIDVVPRWLGGDQSLFDALAEGVAWEQPVVRMYEREVPTPRLVGAVSLDVDPVIGELVEVLSDRYSVHLDRVSAGWYRDGRDSVAWHGDRIARERPTATVATISLGHPRRFLLRPKAGGSSMTWSLGHGDLVVMGGSCQRTYEHAVPKAATAGPRMVVMFRHAYE
jgi:alkylated DNA repair dioxygenase AlkB